ncbi:hypothetical protein ACIRRH_31240 [Kitasatospora sp. NPDC101235]|uniref:hypothetical protein n=1 Tax=Kitasatospora sp. NPDC101235 TaxID=3364101 RepID=UPI00380E2A9C
MWNDPDNRLQGAKGQGWLGKDAAIEASIASPPPSRSSPPCATSRHTGVHLGIPDVRTSAGRLTESPDGD